MTQELAFLEKLKLEINLTELQLVLKGIKPGSYITLTNRNFPSYNFQQDLIHILSVNNKLIKDKSNPDIWWFISLTKLPRDYPAVIFVINSNLINPHKYIDFLKNYTCDKTKLSEIDLKNFHLTLGTLMGYHKESVETFSDELSKKQLRNDRIIISFGEGLSQLGFCTYPEHKESAITLLRKYLSNSANPDQEIEEHTRDYFNKQ
jgi:hypothetical protein